MDMEFVITVSEALADLDYFIHELEESKKGKLLVRKFEKERASIIDAVSIAEVHSVSARISEMFVNSF